MAKAENGVFAALIAEGALEISAHILEGKQGYFKALSDELREEIILSSWGEVYSISKCYLKRHGGCRHIHSSIDAVLHIIKEYAISVREIEKIQIGTYLVAIRDFEIEDPQNGKEVILNSFWNCSLFA